MKSRASRAPEEVGGLEESHARIHWVDFDILHSTRLGRKRTQQIELELNSAEAGAADRAVSRLGRLDTPASVRKLLQLYCDGLTQLDRNGSLASTLRESSQLDVIPSCASKPRFPIHPANVPSSLPQLLADPVTQGKISELSRSYPNDGASKPEWEAKAKRDGLQQNISQRLTLS